MDITDILTLYDCNLKRLRLGNKNDGGYVIFDGLSYDGFVSGGIEKTNLFEDEFIKRYDVDCHAFDCSINALPQQNDRIKFYKQEINKDNNLSHLINQYQSCFVKMDIEGWEWQWLESLDTSTLSRIRQLTIEYHFMLLIDNDTKFDEKKLLGKFTERLNILSKINGTHVMCHIHANNFAQQLKYNDYELPVVFECTYLNKNIFVNNDDIILFKNIRSLPTAYDAPNYDQIDDNTNCLNYPPFVHNDFELVKIM